MIQTFFEIVTAALPDSVNLPAFAHKSGRRRSPVVPFRSHQPIENNPRRTRMSPAKPPAAHPPGVTLRDEARRILSARLEDRADLLVASDNIAALVPRIPPEELLFSLRAAGQEQMLEILACARPSQVRYVLDMELWERDEISRMRAEKWLVLFNGLEEEVVERWVKALNLADLSALMGRSVKASLADEDGLPEKDDVQGTASFTLDGVYYFTAPEKIVPIARKILRNLYQQDPSKYLHVLEILLSGFDIEDEESALAFRNARLAEHGFVDFQEAQGIYVPLAPERLEHMPARSEKPTPDAEEESFEPPLYPLVPLSSEEFLLRALLDRFSGTAEAEALMAQLAHLTNKVVTADALDTAEFESFRQAAWKVAGYLTVGLETIYGTDEERMARAVDRHWLEHIFRVGVGRVNRAVQAARKMLRDGWPSGKKERLQLLDPPLPETLNALLRPRPKWLEAGPEGYQLRDFRNLREVELAERAVAKADFLGRYLLSVVRFDGADAQTVALGLGEGELKGRTIFLTALANAALGKGFTFSPLGREEVAAALSRLWTEGKPPRRVNPALLNAALRRSEEKIRLSAAELEFLREFLAEAAETLEDEFGNLPEGETPDPRFLQGIWIA
jgi:hypothetical protein